MVQLTCRSNEDRQEIWFDLKLTPEEVIHLKDLIQYRFTQQLTKKKEYDTFKHDLIVELNREFLVAKKMVR